MSKTLVCITALLALFLCSTLLVSPAIADQGGAQNAISSAKTAIKDCYTAVSQAEAAGANVDSLMVTLNEAAGTLSMADLAYSSKNYDSAYNYASQTQSKLNGLTAQAASLQQAAEVSVSQSGFFTVLSLVVALAILGAGIGAWIVLNKRERGTSNGS